MRSATAPPFIHSKLKAMQTITAKQIKSLETAIYDLLMSSPEMGMGEMGDCRDESKRVVSGWMEKERLCVITNVKFLLDTDGDVFAFFPDDDYDRIGTLKTCYSHVGQHSACSEGYVSECKKATPEQYKALFDELESIGYNLNVLP